MALEPGTDAVFFNGVLREIVRQGLVDRDGGFITRENPTVPDAEFPLVLTTGRLLAHFLSGNQTRRIERQNRLAPGPYVEVHPATARAYQLQKSRFATLSSRQGAVQVPWVLNSRLRLDTLFMPYHWVECNTLVATDLDPLSRIPGFKYTPVSLWPSSETQTKEEASAAAAERSSAP